MINKVVFVIGLILAICTFNSHAEIIHEERSLYRNIIVEELDDIRCLKFNVKSKESSQSCMLKSNPQHLVFNYTKLTLASLLMVDAPQTVLIIGLGGGTLSNTLHELYPSATIDNIEIDPAVIKVARQYFGFFENEKVRSFSQDGRIFIKRANLKKQQYDLIVLDAFNGDYIPEHLMTVEFFTEIRNLLSEKGVLASNTFSTSKLSKHESASYHAAFGDFYSVTNQVNSNRIIFAGKQLPSQRLINQRAIKLKEKLSPYGVDIIEISNYLRSTKEHKTWSTNTTILTDQFSPANLLNN